MQTLINTAETVGTLLAAVDNASAAAAPAKFDAVINVAAIVGLMTRATMAGGSNFETDGKGRVIAILDHAKAVRTDFLAGLTAARGLNVEREEDAKAVRDCANIASLARTFATYAAERALNSGFLATVHDREADGDQPAETAGDLMLAYVTAIAMDATGGVATYNGLEQARSRKWQAPEAVEAKEADAPQAFDPNAPVAPLEVPAQAAPEPEATADEPPVTAKAEAALSFLSTLAANEGGWEILQGLHFADWLASHQKGLREFLKAEKAIADAA